MHPVGIACIICICIRFTNLLKMELKMDTLVELEEESQVEMLNHSFCGHWSQL